MIHGGIITIAGGGAGTSLGSGVSGIISLNSQTGPAVNIASNDNTIAISAAANVVDLSCSGFVSGVQVTLYNDLGSRIETSGQILLQSAGGDGSGLNSINDQLGPDITFISSDYNIDITAAANQIDLVGSGFLPRSDADWNGFFNRTDSSIAFDHSTRTLSISPTATSFDYYVEGIKYTSTGDSVIIPSGTEGVNVIYYSGPTLVNVTNPTLGQMSQIIRQKALVSVVYWGTIQQSGLYVGEERHGKSMGPDTHAYLHFQEGLRYTSGLGLNSITVNGDGNLDTSAVFGVDSGAASDEDIYLPISAVGSGVGLPIYYMTGSTPNWNRATNPGFSVRTFDGTSSTRLAWNEFTGGVWQLTEVDEAMFVLCHVFATTEKDYPMIAIMGQAQYNDRVEARTGADTEIFVLQTNYLLLPETRPIATLIFETKSVYSNQVKGRIISTEDGDSYIDWRNEEISRFTVSTSDHNALAGLQGGQAGQYYHLTETEYNNLGSGTGTINPTYVRKYTAYFSNFVSGIINHSLDTDFFTYSIFASGAVNQSIIPDRVEVVDRDNMLLAFNKAETGFLTLIGEPSLVAQSGVTSLAKLGEASLTGAVTLSEGSYIDLTQASQDITIALDYNSLHPALSGLWSLGSIQGTPAGSSGQVQFNDAGAFGADSNFHWNNEDKRLGIGTSIPGGSLGIGDGNTYIDIDGSNNLTFTDANAGTLTLSELSCPPYIFIKETSQSEGDLHLSDAVNWNTSKALIKQIRIITSSTDWDLYLLQNDNGHTTNDANIPEIQLMDGATGNEDMYVDIAYEDEDDSNEVHLYWIDNDGSNTVDIYITGFKLR